MTLRVPFMSLVPGPDSAAVREAIDRVIARGWFILGPELAAFEEEFATASGGRHAVGVGHGDRRHRAVAARARHRPGRRSDHGAAVGRVHGAGDHDGGRDAGIRRCRSGSADDRSGGGRSRDHAPDGGDPAGAPVRTAGGHGRASKRSPRGTTSRSSRTPARRTWPRPRAAGWHVRRRPRRSASIRPRTSARSATAAPSSPTTPRSPTS